MTPRPAPSCAHDLRPGTTVCLYCRAEERAVVRARRRRAAVRALAGGGALASVAAMVALGFTALRGGSPDAVAAPAVAVIADTAVVAPSAATVALAGESAARAAASVEPIVPAGRTALADGVFAEREGNVVTVNFDTQGSRTRRSDKFETVVRATLPAVLGDAGQAALDKVVAGGLVPPGGLLTAAQRGALQLPVGDGRVVRLTPQTRMGQDGPLVITYRVTLQPAAAPAS